AAVSANQAQTREGAANTQAAVATVAQGAALLGQQTAAAGIKAAGTQLSAGNSTLAAVNTQAAVVATQVQDSKNNIESLRLAALANDALTSNHPNAEIAALLGIRALHIIYSPQADSALRAAADQLFTGHLLAAYPGRVL